MHNLFDLSVLPEKGETIEDLLAYQCVTIKRIVSSDLLEECTFKQEEAEWVCLLNGYAEILMNRKVYPLQKGETLFIPPLTEHTIQKVEKGTVWLAVHIHHQEGT